MIVPRAGLLLPVALALCLSGCGDSHEAITRDMLSVQKELCTVLDGVKDDASAQEAVARVGQLAEKIKALEQRSYVLGDAPAEVRESLQVKYEDEFKKTAEASRQSLARIDPKYVVQLQDAMTKILSAKGR